MHPRKSGEIQNQRIRSMIPRFTRNQNKEKKGATLEAGSAIAALAFSANCRAASQAALLLDYDGTFAPFHAQRDQAYPYPGVTPLLQEIVRNGRTRVVVISGRGATDVLPLLNIHPRPEVWGVHGLQRMKTDGSMEMPRLDERTLDGLSDADRWLGYQQVRHNAEFKAGSIAVHWRGMSEKDAEDLRARVLLGWRPHCGTQRARPAGIRRWDGDSRVRGRQGRCGSYASQ